MENIKLDNPFKEVQAYMDKPSLPVQVIKQLSSDFNISYKTLRRKDVENLFSKNDTINKLVGKESITHQEYMNLGGNIESVLHDYQRTLEKVIKKAEKVNLLEITKDTIGKIDYKKIATNFGKYYNGFKEKAKAVVNFKHKTALVALTVFAVGSYHVFSETGKVFDTQKAFNSNLTMKASPDNTDTSSDAVENLSQHKIEDVPTVSERKMKDMNFDLTSSTSFKNFCKTLCERVDINSTDKLSSEVNIQDTFKDFAKNLGNNLEQNTSIGAKIGTEQLKTLLLLSKQLLNQYIKENKYDSSFNNDISAINDAYNSVDAAYQQDGEFRYRIKEGLMFNVVKKDG